MADSLRNEENDGIPTFTIGDDVKITSGKYQGAYGELLDITPDGLCTIKNGAFEYQNVLITDLAVN